MKNNDFALSIANGVFFYLCATGSSVLFHILLKNTLIYFDIPPLLNFVACQTFRVVYLILFCWLFFKKTKNRSAESLRKYLKTLVVSYFLIQVIQFGLTYWIVGFIAETAFESWQQYNTEINITKFRVIDSALELIYILILPIYILKKYNDENLVT